jgi:hypothetical protein
MKDEEIERKLCFRRIEVKKEELIIGEYILALFCSAILHIVAVLTGGEGMESSAIHTIDLSIFTNIHIQLPSLLAKRYFYILN